MDPKYSFIQNLNKNLRGLFAPTPSPVQGPSPIPIRNDLQATNSYPSAPGNNEAKGIKYVPSNTGATSTNPVVIAPPSNSSGSALPPAGKTFVNNQVQGLYDAKTGARTAYGESQGAPDMLGGKLVTPSQGNSTADSTGTTGAATKEAESPYLTYMRSLFNPDQLSTAFTDVANANKKLAGIQGAEEFTSNQGRHAAEDAFDATGGTKLGASTSAAGIERKTNRELADLAVQESAAARTAAVYKDTFDTMINAGKTVFDAENAAKAAATEQANKDRTFKQAEDKAAQDKIASDRKFDEDKREFGLQYALDEKKYNLDALKIANENPNSPTAISAKDADSASTMNIINKLISNPDAGSIFGSVGQYKPSLLLGQGGNLALNQFKEIKGKLALENRGKLKGQGAVSDFEGRTLDSAASALDRNLSDADAINELKQIRGAIATSHGLPADVLVRDPKTNESQVVSADSAAIADMVKDGLLVEYQ